MLRRILGAAAAVLVCASVASGGKLAPIIVRGNRMYNSATGERFIIRGITYDYDVSDSHYDATKPINQANLKDMIGSFNAFRLYNAVPTRTYDKFMKHMDELGVYVLISASPANVEHYGKYKESTITAEWGPDGAKVVEGGVTKIQNDLTKTCYPTKLLEYGQLLIKYFAAFDNTLGFVVANEIMQRSLIAAACVKMYTADLKTWMLGNARNMRLLPLAYAGADSGLEPSIPGGKGTTPDDYTVMKIMGLLCGDSMKNGVMERSIDIYLINEYRWCNFPAGTLGPYKSFLDLATGVPIVVAFGEFGCFMKPYVPRTWSMVPYLFSDSTKSLGLTDVISGGFAYTFGEATIGTDAKYRLFTGGSTNLEELPGTVATPDYTNLLAQYKANPSPRDVGGFTKATVCKWTPPEPPATLNRVFKATKSWMPQCDDPTLKLNATDKWKTTSRQDAPCGPKGERCPVLVDAAHPTTENSMCGFELKAADGGGNCTTNAQCGDHGQCKLGDDNKNACKCMGCYSGADCSIYDPAICNTLTSSADTPTVAALVGVMGLVFVGLKIAAAKRNAELRKAEELANAESP